MKSSVVKEIKSAPECIVELYKHAGIFKNTREVHREARGAARHEARLEFPPKTGFSPLLQTVFSLEQVPHFETPLTLLLFFGVQEFETELKPWKFFSHNG